MLGNMRHDPIANIQQEIFFCDSCAFLRPIRHDSRKKAQKAQKGLGPYEGYVLLLDTHLFHPVLPGKA
jgi:hypothetical protein